MRMKFMAAAITVAVMVLAVPAGLAQEKTATIVTVEDALSPFPGRAVVSEYTGPLPPVDPPSRDILQMPGWPVAMGGDPNFAPSRGVVFEDLDGNGSLEIITSSTDYKVYAFDYTGANMPGFPVTVIEMPQRAPSVADLDGDGDMEIVQFTRGVTSGGRLYVIDHQGNVLPGFPVSVNNNNISGIPSLYDLDGDGDLEIITPERAWPLGFLHVFELDGTEWGGGWPVALDHVPTGTAAVGDMEGDGDKEIVFLSYTSIYLLETDGTVCAGWPRQLTDANFSYQSPALADLDGDGDLEIAVGAHGIQPGCYILHHDATALKGWPNYVDTWTYCPPTVTDLERDGEPEILFGHQGWPGSLCPCVFAWTCTGKPQSGFPYQSKHGGGSDGPLTVADVNNDGMLEIFADHNMAIDDVGFVFGIDSRGKDLPGFPLRPDGFTYMNGPTIGDVDGDGDYELGVISYGPLGIFVNLYDLDGTYHPADVDWETYHKRNRRGGLRYSEDKLHLQGDFAVGAAVNVYVHGVPGSKAFLWGSLATGRRNLGGLGWFFLDPAGFIAPRMYNATIPADGEIAVPVTIPNSTGLIGLTVFFQGVTGADPVGGDGAVTNLLGRTIH